MLSRLHLRRPVLAALGIAALAVAPLACGDDDESGDGDATAAAAAPTFADLEGRTFVSTSVEGQELVEGTSVSLTFTDGAISVQGGCNTVNGGVEIENGTLVLGTAATTNMACDPALEAQDEWLVAMLGAGADVTLDGDTLTLTGSGVTITATESA